MPERDGGVVSDLAGTGSVGRDLEERVRALEAENRDLRFRWTATKAAGFGLVGLGAWIMLGPGLTQSLYVWFRRRANDEVPSAEENGDVAAAVVRRVIAVGLIGLIFASLPTLLLWRQNRLLATQNETVLEANRLFREESRTARRAELIDILFAEDCEEVELPDSPAATEGSAEEAPSDAKPVQAVCRPRAHRRARKEALVGFVELERQRETLPDLARIDLRPLGTPGTGFHRRFILDDVDLSRVRMSQAAMDQVSLRRATLIDADFSWASLHEADLREADLRSADLHLAILSDSLLIGADLRGADLRRTNLAFANLRGANLGGADLRSAHLVFTEFRDALLVEADLRGVFLAKAIGLTQDQVRKARGDEKTSLPEGLHHPEHWLDPDQ